MFTYRKGGFKALKKKKSLHRWDNLKYNQTCSQESLMVFGNRPACTLEHVWKAWRDTAVKIKAFRHSVECLTLSLLIFQASLYLRLKIASKERFFCLKKKKQLALILLLFLSGVQTVGLQSLASSLVKSCLLQMHAPRVPGSQMPLRQPLLPRQPYSQVCTLHKWASLEMKAINLLHFFFWGSENFFLATD